MISYLARYQQSTASTHENLRVWAELTSLGAAIRQEPLYSEAVAVARETMLRARQNVATLVDRLKSIGYRFAEPEAAWSPPDADLIARLDQLERRYGALPLSVRAWYETVGTVNFTGSHPRLNHYHSLDEPGSKPWLIYPDPLVIDAFPDALEPFYLNLVGEDSAEGPVGPPYSLELAADAVTKANQSGGGPTAVMIPNPAMDAPLISDQWAGTLFINYLRTCFEWGGFPGWKDQPECPDDTLDLLTGALLSI